MNNNIVLICGKSATGKSASLKDLKDQEGIWYLNCESNKALPFKQKFKTFTITDPMQIYEAFAAAEKKPDVHTIIIDTATYLMDMYESLYVINAANGQKAWGDYAQFFKNLMMQYVAKSTKRVIILAHTTDVLNESIGEIETLVKVKGSLMSNGVESFFSQIVATKKMPLKKLEPFKNDLLTITPQEEMLGYKYVFQTLLTKETVNERIRGQMGMWEQNETFIDNNAQAVLDRIAQYYA